MEKCLKSVSNIINTCVLNLKFSSNNSNKFYQGFLDSRLLPLVHWKIVKKSLKPPPTTTKKNKTKSLF